MSASESMSDENDLTKVSIGEDYPEVRQAVRAICAKYPGAYWRRLEDSKGYPDEFVAELTEAGFMAALIPENYGGSGLPLRAGGIILEEISASGGEPTAVHGQMYMMAVLLRHGSAAQKARYLPEIAAGKLRYQSFGVTEPTTGSDTLQLKTRAVRDGNRYIINGQKIFTSRAEHSDLMTLLARTTPADQVKRRTDGLSLFLIDIREALGRGLKIRPIETMFNHHTTEVFYDDVSVPVENLIGEEGMGFRYILDGLNSERILVSHSAIGDCRFFIEKACNYARERVVFGKPIGQNQGIQFPLARAYAEWRAADLMVRTAAALFEAGQSCGEEANLSRLLSADAAWNSAEACLQTHGGYGVTREFDVERRWRSVRNYRIAPVSTNLILAYIAHTCLRLPKSY
jgi:acyl-CoA dehydrogenase